MLVAVISVSTLAEASVLLDTAHADAFELRIDELATIDLDALQEFCSDTIKPVILTLRSQADGGNFVGPEVERLGLLQQLAALEPAYIDIESHVSSDFIESISHFKSKIIRSYHNFDNTPVDLDNIFDQLQHRAVSIYKMTCFANSSLDTLRMLQFVQDKSPDHSVVGHCMGALGEPSRVLGPVVGNYFCYANVNHQQPVAPGILDLETMVYTYRINKLNKETRIYGLIGQPVTQSLGHVFHNKAFEERGVNAAYVKFDVAANNLDEFLARVTKLPFNGFSVTMPHKQSVISCCDSLDETAQAITAVNTLCIKDSKITGSNTDGAGALDAIEQRSLVKGKSLLILGAGGAACAIVFEASKRGANVTIANRTLDKATQLAFKFNANAVSLEELECGDFDIIINTCPPDLKLCFLKKVIVPKTIFMNINYYTENDFVPECVIVTGKAMFEGQAQLQQDAWLK